MPGFFRYSCAFFGILRRTTRKTFTDATTFTDALDGVVCDFDALVDPTTVPPELQTACQQLCTRAGLPDEICHGEVGILSLLDVTKDRQ